MSRRRNQGYQGPQGSIYLPPSHGLTIGNAIVQGVNGAIQNINQMRMRQYQLQTQRLMAQSMQQYRAAQGEALKNRYGPITTTIGKLQAINDMVKGGQISPDIGNKMLTKGYNELYQMADSPDKVNYVKQSMGSMPGAPGAGRAQGAPSAPAAQPQPQMNPADQPVTLSYAEQKMMGQALGSQGHLAQAQVQGANQLNVAKERGKAAFAAQQEATNRAIQVAQAHGASAQAVAKIQADGKIQAAKIAGQYGLDKTDLAGQYSVDASTNRGVRAAAVRAKAATAPGVDKSALQAQKGVMDQIKGLQQQYTDADKSNNLGISPLPDQVAQRRQMIQSQLDQKKQEYIKAGGKDLWGVSQQGDQSGAQNASPKQPNVFDYGNHDKAQAGDLIKFPNGSLHQVTAPGKVDPNPYAPPAQAAQPAQAAPMPQAAPPIPPQLQAILSGQNSSSMAPAADPVSSAIPGQ